MLKNYLNLVLFLFTVLLYSQQNNLGNKKDLNLLIVKCEKLQNNYDFLPLRKLASKGISKSKGNDYYNARFHYFKAYSYEYDNNLYDQAIPYYEKSLEYAKKGKNLKEETLALMRLNYLYYSTKQFDKRISLIRYITKVIDTTKSNYTLGILNGSLGEYYLDNSEFEKFITYKLKAIEYRKKFPKSDKKNIINIGISYSQIGEAYIKMKQYSKALEYLDLAKPYLYSSPKATAFIYNDYLKCFLATKNKDSIYKYYKETYELVSKEDSLYINISVANSYLAEYYISTKEMKKAAYFAKKGVDLALKSNDEANVMASNITNAKILLEQKKYQQVIANLNTISKYAKEFDKESFVIVNDLLSKSYSNLNNWKLALKYSKIHDQLNNELLQESVKQSIANAEAKFQNQKKQEKINLLSTENLLKNVQLENSKRNQIYFLIGLILLMIIVGLLYKQSENRKRINLKLQNLNVELDKANKIKARFFSILNHDLRSPISNLIHFLHLQRENPEMFDEESKTRLQNKTIKGAENLLASMEDILIWSKGQMENFELNLKKTSIHQIFEDIKKHFESQEHINFTFINDNNIYLKTDEDYLKTILRNLTGNAVSALRSHEKASIEWKVWAENNTTFMSITDNGYGAKQEQFKALYDENQVVGIKTGLGLHLIRDLAKVIHCSISHETIEGIGTTFVLKFN